MPMSKTAKTTREDALYAQKYLDLLVDIKKEFPEFAVINKRYSKFSQMLGRLTFWNKEFNSRYTTTIGPKIYVNYSWDERTPKERYSVMIHERIHMRQTQKYGLLAFFLVFGLVPAPLKLAYYRMKWEMEAYRIGIYLTYKKGGRKAVLSEKYRNYLLDQFCGPFYLWMWYSERYIMKWLLKIVRQIESGELTWDKLRHFRRLPAHARPLTSQKLLKFCYPEEFA